MRTERHEPLRVFVISGDALARSGLHSLIDGTATPVVGACAPTGDPVGGVSESRADIALWDLGTDGALPARLVAALHIPVVVLASSAEQAAEAMSAGACATLARDGDPRKLLVALEAASYGLRVTDDSFAERVLRPAASDEVLLEPLTDREREVLQLLAEGLSNRAVGETLGVTEHTAKFHVNAILSKLGARSRTEAVVRAMRAGLLLL